MAAPLAEIAMQSWGVVWRVDENGVFVPVEGEVLEIVNLDDSAVTVYEDRDGTIPLAGVIETDGGGVWPGFVPTGTYKFTEPIDETQRYVPAVDGDNILHRQSAQKGTLGAPTATTYLSVQPRDPAKGPFQIVLGGAAFNGTWDSVMYLGYNMGNAGARPVPSEPSFGIAIEQDYEVVEGEHWVEMYAEYRHDDGVIAGRPWFIRVNRDDGNMEGFDIRSNGVAFTDWGNDAQFAAIGGKTGAYYALGHASQLGPTVLDLTAQNNKEVGLGLHSFRGDFTIYNPATDQWAFAVDAGLEAFMQVSEGTGNPIGFGNADVGQNATVAIQSKDGVKTFYPTLKLKTISGQDQNLLSLQDSANVELAAFTVTGSLLMVEQTEPAAPAANKVLLYSKDNGAGKTQLMARFSSGASQQIAIQP